MKPFGRTEAWIVILWIWGTSFLSIYLMQSESGVAYARGGSMIFLALAFIPAFIIKRRLK
jgi:hypothetical protein